MRPLKIAGYSALAIAGLAIVAAVAVYLTLRASLPQLDGELAAPTLKAAATIARDELGTPTIRGTSRKDVAFATGYAHGQDRFFQMDLMRRAAAGELAELLGKSVLDLDAKYRIHGFRRIAFAIVHDSAAVDREVLEAYTAGVNFALSSAGARPWEYTLLRSQPVPWRVEDSVLVAFSMYLNLNDSSGAEEMARAQLHEVLPRQLYDFLYPLGTEWDAPFIGSPWRGPSIPGADVFSLRTSDARTAALTTLPSPGTLDEEPFVGSNGWAVAGTRTKDNAALLASDMHLTLRLPHIWYRVRMIVESGAEARDLVGVTLPGLPMLIAGSNGHIAWGYTNSYGDFSDIVVVEPDARDATSYVTVDGAEHFKAREELLAVRGAEPEHLTVPWTRWGPIVGHDDAGRPLALRWTAHDLRATNLHMLDFETAANVEEALRVANRAGGPVQNVMVADADGHIGWSLMGQVPIRGSYDSTLPHSWREPGGGWTGWRAPEEYPRVIDPASGRLWSANARTIDTETWLAFLGDGGYDLGARAAQIRDDLLALPTASAADMTSIQLDDRALFLARWRDLLLDLLNDGALAKHPLRVQARELIEHWSGRAAVDDAGYRIVRATRLQVRKDVYESLTALARQRYPSTKFTPSAQFEGPLWQLVTQRPAHLVDPHYPSWDAALLGSLDRVLASLEEECKELRRCTWGEGNVLQMRHPLSAALPFASHWLDMPAEQLPGDAQMPRVQGAAFGASQRMVVSPGREAQGSLQMPGGPVDHPLSPFYGAGHEAWARGEPTPLLPGAAKHTLTLRPPATLSK
ncbi:MAG TPA: penicillin acylase family protein [Steroidobacteraceae bacterium]|nr:penicillin acylase family protein [Steroidobacteraceae bacterium]